MDKTNDPDPQLTTAANEVALISLFEQRDEAIARLEAENKKYKEFQMAATSRGAVDESALDKEWSKVREAIMNLNKIGREIQALVLAEMEYRNQVARTHYQQAKTRYDVLKQAGADKTEINAARDEFLKAQQEWEEAYQEYTEAEKKISNGDYSSADPRNQIID